MDEVESNITFGSSDSTSIGQLFKNYNTNAKPYNFGYLGSSIGGGLTQAYLQTEQTLIDNIANTKLERDETKIIPLNSGYIVFRNTNHKIYAYAFETYDKIIDWLKENPVPTIEESKIIEQI